MLTHVWWDLYEMEHKTESSRRRRLTKVISLAWWIEVKPILESEAEKETLYKIRLMQIFFGGNVVSAVIL